MLCRCWGAIIYNTALWIGNIAPYLRANPTIVYDYAEIILLNYYNNIIVHYVINSNYNIIIEVK